MQLYFQLKDCGKSDCIRKPNHGEDRRPRLEGVAEHLSFPALVGSPMPHETEQDYDS